MQCRRCEQDWRVVGFLNQLCRKILKQFGVFRVQSCQGARCQCQRCRVSSQRRRLHDARPRQQRHCQAKANQDLWLSLSNSWSHCHRIKPNKGINTRLRPSDMLFSSEWALLCSLTPSWSALSAVFYWFPTYLFNRNFQTHHTTLHRPQQHRHAFPAVDALLKDAFQLTDCVIFHQHSISSHKPRP